MPRRAAGEEAKAAEAARDAAVEASEEANRKTSPVSVFISRKTQRLYIRQGYLPVFEGPVTIRDADKPIGSFVYTALGYLNNGADVRWNVVSMYKYANGAEPVTQPARKRGDGRGSGGIPADVVAAKAALDRIAIPQDALERISEVVLPGSSLIISDEGASIETGKDTDFVVLMSGEPQGGLKTRRREPRAATTTSSAAARVHPSGSSGIDRRRSGVADLHASLAQASSRGFSGSPAWAPRRRAVSLACEMRPSS